MWYGLNRFIKRLFDLIFSIIGLVIASPVFLIIAICIKVDSEGPVFFKQNRLGKDGKVFKIFKFRTMVQNAEKMGSGIYSYAGDSRITKVGNFLRNSSLDEIPQLINVLLGNMSFIGPRPAVTYELGDFATLNRKYRNRFSVKPGISGLAQTKGRNDNDWEEKVTLDNRYIELFKKYGYCIDLWLIFATVLCVFKHGSVVEAKIDDSLSDIEAAKKAEEEIIRRSHEEV